MPPTNARTANAVAVTDLRDQVRAMTRPASGVFDRLLDGWFGPSDPLTPVAPKAEVDGRQFDYPVAVNLQYGRPKSESSESGVTYKLLRQFAEPGQGGLDLLRLAIETRKDQMCAMEWTVQDENGKSDTPETKRITELLRKPDGQRTWTQWLRMVLEDHFVLDAVAIFPRQARGRMLLELMDGATIKRIIDLQGRTPLAPFPAYQQILKGMPAADYTVEQIRYFTFNPRTNRIYGMSRVEQVVNTVALYLRRFLHVQEFYTSGSVPDMLVGCPPEWNAAQVQAMQTFFDSVVAGDSASRRKVHFIPGGSAQIPTKDAILKDEFDEWCARIICFAFSLSPQAFVKEMNRATAETAEEQAKEEGLEPMKLAIAEIVNDLIQGPLGAPGYTLAWADEDIQDPKVKAEVTAIATGGKAWMRPQEARESYGLPELTPEELEDLNPAPAPGMFGLGGEDGEGDEGAFGGKKKPKGAAGDDADEDADDDADDEPAIAKVRRARRRSLHGYGAPRSHQ